MGYGTVVRYGGTVVLRYGTVVRYGGTVVRYGGAVVLKYGTLVRYQMARYSYAGTVTLVRYGDATCDMVQGVIGWCGGSEMWHDGHSDFGVKVQYTVCVMVVWQLGSGARWPGDTAHNVNGRTAGWCRGCGCDSWRFGSMIAVAFCFKIGWWCFGSVGCRFPVLLPNLIITCITRMYG